MWDLLVLFCVLGLILVVCFRLISVLGASQKKNAMEERINSLKNFTTTHGALGNDGMSGIAIDEKRKKICLTKHHRGKIILDVMSYKDLLTSEIFEDGATITRTSRSSQAGGALLGGLALGGVGAVIGGLSGKKISSDNAKRIDLRLTVNRTDSPVHDINFMDDECKKSS